MALNFLAICVGNTRTKLGAFADDKLIDPQAIANSQPEKILQAATQAYAQAGGGEILLASVSPAVSDRLIVELERELPRAKLLRVEKDLPIPIGRQLDRETIVGDDRLLNAAAAYDTLKQACVIVDSGTAITVDFVDGAGTFHGGAIAPGAQLMLTSLHEHTAQLPDATIARPEEPIGHNTLEAMRVGAYYGLRGMVRELVEKYAELAGAYPMVVATGGDAPLLFEDFELVERVVPDLTLLGMAATMRATNVKANDDDDDDDDDET